MTTVSILGTGKMGSAIAAVLSKGGATVEQFNSADVDKPVTGDIVVLAVPYPKVAGVLAERAGQFAGKVVVDVTNPLNFETFDSLTVAPDGSAAAEIAAALPDARVVKAFNTNFAGALAAGTVGERPTSVLIAGDDADAKALLAGLVTAGGLDGVDVGSLRRARELEGIALLQITLASSGTMSWAGGFTLVP